MFNVIEDHQFYWLFLSLSFFYLFLTAEVHFLKWDILRPRCHKRFTQCPLCNSCKTQTKLLLTPHAVPPPTKWNPRTTVGFWPITLEGDGDWKQCYESRSVIKSLLLGQRSGWGDGVLCETTKHLFCVWIHNISQAKNCPDLLWFNICPLSWQVLLPVAERGKRRVCDGVNISEMWHPKPRSDGVSFPAGETRKMICWGTQGSERALKTGGTTSHRGVPSGNICRYSGNSQKQNISLQKKATPPTVKYSEVINSAPAICP